MYTRENDGKAWSMAVRMAGIMEGSRLKWIDLPTLHLHFDQVGPENLKT